MDAPITVWTLWLVTLAPIGGTPAVTPLATYANGTACLATINTIVDQVNKEYSGLPPAYGTMICVPGNPVKR
jgi:hypothetical protein